MLIPVNLPPTHQRTALTGAQPSRLRSTNRVVSTLSGYERLPFTGKQANQLFFINYFLKCLQKYRTEECLSGTKKEAGQKGRQGGCERAIRGILRGIDMFCILTVQ